MTNFERCELTIPVNKGGSRCVKEVFTTNPVPLCRVHNRMIEMMQIDMPDTYKKILESWCGIHKSAWNTYNTKKSKTTK
jgi:hypothetical protein